jgi:hypothetical protein
MSSYSCFPTGGQAPLGAPQSLRVSRERSQVPGNLAFQVPIAIVEAGETPGLGHLSCQDPRSALSPPTPSRKSCSSGPFGIPGGLLLPRPPPPGSRRWPQTWVTGLGWGRLSLWSLSNLRLQLSMNNLVVGITVKSCSASLPKSLRADMRRLSSF